MKEQLFKAETMAAFIETLGRFYDLHNNKPSKMIMQILVTAIQAAINIQDKYIVEAALKSLTLYDFLLTFAVYYDELNDLLTDRHKQKLIDKIPVLITTTRCKEIK